MSWFNQIKKTSKGNQITTYKKIGFLPRLFLREMKEKVLPSYMTYIYSLVHTYYTNIPTKPCKELL